ncbi:hypothetical protein PHYPSEUDO_006452 [Phytophthora pseudosyringae]|uniref:HTH myb-type domain-containing protein n=1 Tax=Phytophthora pseudosyringae TaxID=221518 RepID=A0A8T1VIH1_9STRA|nr:hypothetical protein PHYPSEUDO_006452 [Phytophthora pseudosyringae]
MNPSAARSPDGSDSTAEPSRRNDDVQAPTRSPGGKHKHKRLVWTDDLQLRFVSAVFELGVKNASPKALLALMETKSPTEGLTTDHIKSHLQKYRINYERSRLEVERLGEKHAKRSLRRHHRHTQHRGAGGGRGVGGGVGGVGEFISGTSDQGTSSGPPGRIFANATLAQYTNQQWHTCDALLLEDAALEQRMHMTMQQRMDFHRELLLTRSVEVASGLSWATRMNSSMASTSIGTGTGGAGNNSERQDTSFLQAWANAEQLRHQEEQVYGRLHEQQQSLFQQAQDAAPVAPFSVSGSQPEPPPRAADENLSADGDVDLSSWGRLSLTVDPDDNDVFGFLGS